MIQRGSFAITTLILEAVLDKPLTKTKIMQELVLSYPRTMRYLALMLDQGTLQFDSQNHTFGITEKGLQVLQASKELASYIDPINQMINKYAVCLPNAEERIH
jgi:predicted transcriptional regulator